MNRVLLSNFYFFQETSQGVLSLFFHSLHQPQKLRYLGQDSHLNQISQICHTFASCSIRNAIISSRIFDIWQIQVIDNKQPLLPRTRPLSCNMMINKTLLWLADYSSHRMLNNVKKDYICNIFLYNYTKLNIKLYGLIDWWVILVSALSLGLDFGSVEAMRGHFMIQLLSLFIDAFIE